jgi:siroheme synthase (precorrin-2 oxidase/ferrochelatase)
MGWFDWLFARRNTKIEDKKISISKKKVNPVLTEIVKEGVENIIEKEMEEATIELAKFEEPKRARTSKGTYVADDPTTKDVNEAWVGGRAPKPKKKKVKVKKTSKKK